MLASGGHLAAQIRLECGTVDLDRHRVVRSDGPLALTATEAQLLDYLARNPWRSVTREELYEHVWQYQSGVSSRALDQAIKRLRPKIELDRRTPRHLITIYGVGYRFQPLEEQLDPASSFRSLRAVQVPSRRSLSTNLEAHPEALLGRASELTDLSRELSEVRLLTLLGPPGIGKSRLAEALALDWLEARTPQGGVWKVELEPARDLEDIARAAASALHLNLTQHEGAAEAIEWIGRCMARGGEALYVLDGFEHLGQHGEASLGTWLRAAPGARFLVSSRTPLGLPTERCREVPPLPPAAAAELFEERASAAARGRASRAAKRSVGELVERLDCNPLAIELAAGRSALLPAGQLLQRLDASLPLLSRPDGRGGRHRSIEAAVRWSWDLLAAHEQVALARCAVFQGSFSLEAAEAVLDPGPAGSVLDVLQSLRDHSLIRILPPARGAGGPRLGLFASIRAFAAQRLAESGQEAEALRRCRDFFVPRTRALGESLEHHWDPVGPLLPDLETLRTIEHHSRSGDPAERGEAALALDLLLEHTGPAAERRRVLAGALDSPHGLTPSLRARLHARLGALEARRGQPHRGLEHLRTAWECVEEAAEPVLGVSLANLQSQIHRQQGEDDKSVAAAERAVEVARRASAMPWLEAIALATLGRAHGEMGRLQQADELFSRGLSILLEEGRTAQAAYLHYCLGYSAMEQNRPEAALAAFRRAIDALEEEGSPAADLLEAMLGHVALDQGDLDEAERCFSLSTRYSGGGNFLWRKVEDLFFSGAVTFLRGEVDQALEAWTAAERISDRLGRADFMIEPLRAAALVLTDRLGEAKALLAQAPERCSGAARPQIGRAIVAAAEGDLDEAERIVVELQASGTMTDRLAARVVREGLRQLNAQSKP